MSRFVNPFTDQGFKGHLRQPASKGLLITLLNEVVCGRTSYRGSFVSLDKEDHADNVHDKRHHL